MLPVSLLSFQNKTVELVAGKRSSFDELYVDFQKDEQPEYIRFTLMVHPKKDVRLDGLQLEFPIEIGSRDLLHHSGFLADDASAELPGSEQMSDTRQSYIRPVIQTLTLDDQKAAPTHPHSWTYAYVRQGAELFFLGSLNERTAFTAFEYDLSNGLIRVFKDCRQLELKHSFPLLDLFVSRGLESDVFDRYFRLMEFSVKPSDALFSRTHSGLQTPAQTSDNDVPDPFDLVWLDWQDEKASAIETDAKMIREKDCAVGIRLSPFACSPDSEIVRRYPDWLCKNEKGQLKSVKRNDRTDSIYILDFYQKGVQDFLTGQLNKIGRLAGLSLIAFDDLYLTGFQQRPGKTRAQIMSDALQFLRESIGDQKMLCTSVPLGTVFGLADYCRVSPVLKKQAGWGFLSRLFGKKEDGLSSVLRSLFARHPLNGRAFWNNGGCIEFNSKADEQQYSLMMAQALLCKILYVDVKANTVSAEEISELTGAAELLDTQILKITPHSRDLYQVDYQHRGNNFAAYFNLASKPVILKNGLELAAGQMISLKK